MKVKWWRWWIVPLILTITFEVGVARLLVIGLGNLWGEMSAGYSFTRLLLSGLFVFIPPDAAIVMWPLFLGLVWPAALIVHGVWKRRKAKKQVSVRRAMTITFRWWWVPTFLSVLIAAFLIFVVLKPPYTSLGDLGKALCLVAGVLWSPVLLLMSWELSLTIHGIWKKVQLKKEKDTRRTPGEAE